VIRVYIMAIPVRTLAVFFIGLTVAILLQRIVPSRNPVSFQVVENIHTFFKPPAESFVGHQDKVLGGRECQDSHWKNDLFQESGIVAGIQLGRTFSRIGIYRNDKFEIIVDGEGRSEVPSYVMFTDDGPPLVGYPAMEQALDNPKNTVYNFRLDHLLLHTCRVHSDFIYSSLMGRRKFSDPDLQRVLKHLPYEVVPRDDDTPMIRGRKNGVVHDFHPVEIPALIIGELKHMVEVYLCQPLSSAVIAVPSEFDHDQRQAAKDAGIVAGINIFRVMSESTAAGMGYSLGFNDTLRYFIFYHMDIEESRLALISLDRGVFENIAVIREEYHGSRHFEEYQMDDMEMPEISLRLVERLLKEAHLEKGQVDGLMIVGNSTHFAHRQVQHYLGQYLGKKALSAAVDSQMPVNSDEAILRGVSIQATIPEPNEDISVTLLDVLPLDLGVELRGGIQLPLIPRNNIIPTRKSKKFVTVSDNQDKVVIKIMEGCRKIASKNRVLGTLEMVDLPRRPEGEVELDVAFNVDDTMLTVIVTETETKREERLEIPLSRSRYTQDEIDAQVQEAAEYYEEDTFRAYLIDIWGDDSEGLDEFGIVLKPVPLLQ
jgi:heat shock protein 5